MPVRQKVVGVEVVQERDGRDDGDTSVEARNFAEPAGGDERGNLVPRLGRLAFGRREGGLNSLEIGLFERLGKLTA